MSKIGTEVVVGQIFKPIVTTLTYTELDEFRTANTSIDINNALIFSIPQKDDGNGHKLDDEENTSIWVTDNYGQLCPMSLPWSMYSEIINRLNAWDRQKEKYGIKCVVWDVWYEKYKFNIKQNDSNSIISDNNGTISTNTSSVTPIDYTYHECSYTGTAPNINHKVYVWKEGALITEEPILMSITGIKVYEGDFTNEYIPSYDKYGNPIHWYDKAGTYYIKGLVSQINTGEIISTLQDYPLIWEIRETIKASTNVSIREYVNNKNDKYAEYIIKSNVEGIFTFTNSIPMLSDGVTRQYTITKNNKEFTSGYLNANEEIKIRIKNNDKGKIKPTLTYTFIPKEYNRYEEINDGSYTVPNNIYGNAILYWYAGAGPVNASSTPGSDSNWHLISGTPASIATGSLSNGNIRINWVLAVPTSLGLNRISNGALDVTATFDVTTVTCADGVEYIVFRQAEDTKRINYIFVNNNNNTPSVEPEPTGTIEPTGEQSEPTGEQSEPTGEQPQINNYWYAGAGPVNASSTPGSDSNWHLISGTPTSIATGSLSNGNIRINWVLAVPTSLGLNHISNGVLDVTTTFDVTTVTCANGVEYIVFRQAEDTKRINYYFIN